tara:strand:- start:1172 stop:1351 length:180 start_codon:yes stop_codon:yes gene_type:complete
MEHDKYMINKIKLDVEEWMTTYGQIQMGEESAPDVLKVIDESVERTKRIRKDWELPDRC